MKIINVGQSGPINNIQFKDLDEKTQDVVLSREIIFQEMGDSGTARKAGKDLIPIDPGLRNEILDSASLQELWNSDKTIRLPTIDTRQFSESMYISRQLSVLISEESSGDSSQVHGRFVDPLDNPSESLEKFNQLVSIEDKGKIEWLTQDDRAKTEAWKILPSFFHKQLTSVEREEQQPTSVKTIESFHEREVIQMNGNRVILSGVAGTGRPHRRSFQKCRSNGCCRLCTQFNCG